MAASDLTTLANIKAWLALSTGSDDAVLARLITATSSYIQSWLGRTLAVTAYDEVRNGQGGTRMAFANAPVTAVASLRLGRVTIPPVSGPHTAGYLFDDTLLYLRGHAFWEGEQNVSISYSAGFATIPPEIEQACIELVAQRYRERDRIGRSSTSLQGESAAFVVKDLSPDVQTILQKYQKVVLL